MVPRARNVRNAPREPSRRRAARSMPFLSSSQRELLGKAFESALRRRSGSRDASLAMHEHVWCRARS
eukprot:271516-Lingulodinium_polyedra.AAC.1